MNQTAMIGSGFFSRVGTNNAGAGSSKSSEGHIDLNNSVNHNRKQIDEIYTKRADSIGVRPTTDSMTSYNNMHLVNQSMAEPRTSTKSGVGSIIGAP